MFLFRIKLLFRSFYQLNTNTAKNLAGHHRSIAYRRETGILVCQIMLFQDELSYHADTLIENIKIH
jgi:hypothetical protein